MLGRFPVRKKTTVFFQCSVLALCHAGTPSLYIALKVTSPDDFQTERRSPRWSTPASDIDDARCLSPAFDTGDEAMFLRGFGDVVFIDELQ